MSNEPSDLSREGGLVAEIQVPPTAPKEPTAGSSAYIFQSSALATEGVRAKLLTITFLFAVVGTIVGTFSVSHWGCWHRMIPVNLPCAHRGVSQLQHLVSYFRLPMKFSERFDRRLNYIAARASEWLWWAIDRGNEDGLRRSAWP
jgi:hypothetical protein